MGTPVILDIHDILPEFYTSKLGRVRNPSVSGFCREWKKVPPSFPVT